MKYDCAYYKMFLLFEVLKKTPNLSNIWNRIDSKTGCIVVTMYYRDMPVTMYLTPYHIAKYTNTQLAEYTIKRCGKIYMNSIYGQIAKGDQL